MLPLVNKNMFKIINLINKSEREINFEFDRRNFGRIEMYYFSESKFMCVYQKMVGKIDYLNPFSNKPFLIPTFSLDLDKSFYVSFPEQLN